MSDLSRLQQRLLRPLAHAAVEIADDAEELAAGATAASKTARTSRAVGAAGRAGAAAGILGRAAESVTTTRLRALGNLFPNWRAGLQTVLRRAGIEIPVQLLREMALELDAALATAGRTLAASTPAQLQQLEDLARLRLLSLSSAVDEQLFRAAARRAALALGVRRPPRTALVTVPVPGGRWVYVVPATRGDLVLAEAFAPTVRGTPVPRNPPPLPGVPAPRWVLADGSLSPVRPTTPNLGVSTALPPAALDQAPGELLASRRGAEARRLGASAGTITGAPIQYLNVPQHLRGAIGGAVRTVSYRATGPGRYLVTAVGRVGPRAARIRDLRDLTSVSELFGPDSGIERLHLLGAILGDSITAGIGYGPKSLNDATGQIERIISNQGLARKPGIEFTVTGLMEMREVLGAQHPFLRRATYQWVDAGTPYTFTVGLDDVTNAVYIRGGPRQEHDLLHLFGERHR